MEGADAQGGAVPPGKIYTGLPRTIGEFDSSPDSIGAVTLKVTPDPGRIRRSESLQENLLRNRACQFGAIKLCEPHRGAAGHAPIDPHGMLVGDVTRNQKA
jgi:hypothetical protein